MKTTFIVAGLMLFSFGITSRAYASPVFSQSELSIGISLQPSHNLTVPLTDHTREGLADRSASYVLSTTFSKRELSAEFLNTGLGPLPESVLPNVPEPATILLLTTGLLGVISRARAKSLLKNAKNWIH